MGFFSSQKDPSLQVAAAEPKPQESLPPAKVVGTLIAQGVAIKGTIRGEGVVRVEGVVEGEFHMAGAVIVADTGVVHGPINADVLRVAGRVEGNVTAREHVRLEQTGTLIGDVTTASLVVEDGGILNGRSTMSRSPEPTTGPLGACASSSFEFGPDYDPDRE